MSGGKRFYTTGAAGPNAKYDTEYVYADISGREPYHKIEVWRDPDDPKHKTCRQFKWEGEKWVPGAPEEKIPYNLRALLKAPPEQDVIVTEGEPDSDTLERLGLLATTNPGGAGKWQPELTPYFRGKQTVIILEDNDRPGRRHVRIVANNLIRLDNPPEIWRVSFKGSVPHGEDVRWWIENLLGKPAAEANEEELARAREALLAFIEKHKKLPIITIPYHEAELREVWRAAEDAMVDLGMRHIRSRPEIGAAAVAGKTGKRHHVSFDLVGALQPRTAMRCTDLSRGFHEV